jgi:cytochrome d ubiquinol oxidase subunit I
MIDDLAAARGQMELSLSFHIVFAVLGVGMPWLVFFAEWRGLRTGDPCWTALARRWSKAVAVLFAVGAVSGTVLSVEFGLLWPVFMARFGSALGLSFTLESFAFFVEAIFLALHLYGWTRLSPRVHLLCGLPVAVGGMASALFVTTANAWMNGPVGLVAGPGGGPVATEPLGPFRAPTAAPQLVHMGLAALMCTGCAVAAVYALAVLRAPARRDGYHRRGLAAGTTLGLAAAPLQVLVGDWASRAVAAAQPAKFAAMEDLPRTVAGAPLRAGPLDIPKGLSLLLYLDPHARVTGMDSVPPPDRPPVPVVHVSFQLMVGLGTALVMLARVGPVALHQPQGPPGNHAPHHPAWLPAGHGGGRAGAVRGPADRLGGHRGGPPAVDRLPGDAGARGADQPYRAGHLPLRDDRGVPGAGGGAGGHPAPDRPGPHAARPGVGAR